MANNKRPPFWMIYRPGGHGPAFMHPTEAKAKAEAERLAFLNPGELFFVLKAVAACQVAKPVQWEEIDTDEIPF